MVAYDFNVQDFRSSAEFTLKYDIEFRTNNPRPITKQPTSDRVGRAAKSEVLIYHQNGLPRFQVQELKQAFFVKGSMFERFPLKLTPYYFNHVASAIHQKIPLPNCKFFTYSCLKKGPWSNLQG